MNWDIIIGGAIASVLATLLAWWTRGTRSAQDRADIASADASTNVVELMRGELSRIAERVHNLERRELILLRHIYKLEALLRDVGKEPPEFDVDGSSR